MSEKKSDEGLISLGMSFTNLTEEEAKKLDILIRDVAAKHGVEVQIEMRNSGL